MEIISERIRARKEELGLSFTQLGYQMNVSARTVQEWCYGNNLPRSGDIARLCNVLQCSPNYLFGWNDRDLISRKAAMDSLVKEYNRRYQLGDRGGLKLAWIEKAIDEVPTI